MSPAAVAVAVTALFFAVCLACAMVTVTRGRRERRQFDADMAAYDDEIEANRARSPLYAARHAARAPRQDQDFRADRKTGGGLPGPSPTTQGRQRRPRRVVTTATTAGSVAPVIWPGPGTAIPVRPQPASHPGRPTAALDRLTDTGWMRAIEGDTNQFIHEMRHAGEQYRKGLRTRVAACARPREGGPGTGQPAGRAPRPTSLLRDADDTGAEAT